jgi:hypothetical protein
MEKNVERGVVDEGKWCRRRPITGHPMKATVPKNRGYRPTKRTQNNWMAWAIKHKLIDEFTLEEVEIFVFVRWRFAE